jgi:hypothetical protein
MTIKELHGKKIQLRIPLFWGFFIKFIFIIFVLNFLNQTKIR